MWQFAQLLVVLAVVIGSEASPKRYHGLPVTKSVKDRVPIQRLSPDVVPNEYTIELTVTEKNLINKNFSGDVTIGFEIQKALSSFPIHAKLLTNLELQLQNSDKESITGVGHYLDEPNEFLYINSSTSLSEGNYSLRILYEGQLSDTDMKGLYVSSYTEDNDTVYLATTQFEQSGARRAFPCFDEPALKAIFNVIINHDKEYHAYSNGEGTDSSAEEGGLVKTTFTPINEMSTYLAAFIVAKYECTPQTNTSDVPTEVCTRRDAKKDAGLAAATAPEVLNKMKDYTDIAYSELGNEKMTQAAIPDFSAGAMENWGLVTYREADLLYDVAESSESYKKAVVTVIAHEFGHQWFGDFVTLDWWSDVFLNEGFATYFEYHTAAQIQSEWELERQFVVDQVQPVLVTDSHNTTVSLHSDVKYTDEISQKFDDISYNKGGSILRMVHHFLTLDVFKQGLNKYLNKSRVGTPENLWSSFDEVEHKDLPTTVVNITENWTNKPGYPLLNVTLPNDDSNITISQSRFLVKEETGEDTKWYVPITYTTSNDTNFENTETKVWLTPEEDVSIDLEGAEWIVLNNQQVGFYRVYYDDTLLEKIKSVLEKNITIIDEISRSQLVDDQLNFARAGYKKYRDVFNFIGFLNKDDSYYTWNSAFNGFSYLLQRTSDTKVKNAIKNYIKQQADTLFKSVSFNKSLNTQVDILKQTLAQTWACNLDDETCVKQAKDSFAAQNSVKPDWRIFVYCTALRTSDKPSDDYDVLWNRYLATDLATEQVTILRTLGCVNSQDKRKEFLNQALGKEVRLQDARYVFQSVYTNNGVGDVIDFITDKYKDFEGHFGTTSTLSGLISSVADQITSQSEIDKLSTLGKLEDLDEDSKAAVDAATQSAKRNLETIKSLESELRDYFNLSNSAVTSGFHFVNLALAFVVYLFFNL